MTHFQGDETAKIPFDTGRNLNKPPELYIYNPVKNGLITYQPQPGEFTGFLKPSTASYDFQPSHLLRIHRQDLFIW